MTNWILVVAVVAAVPLAYELHDEIFDDDQSDSVVDSVWIVAGLLALDVAVILSQVMPS